MKYSKRQKGYFKVFEKTLAEYLKPHEIEIAMCHLQKIPMVWTKERLHWLWAAAK